MAENSAIEWTDHTFNPWIGCSKVAEGCKNCYAERSFDKHRKHAKWGPGGTRKKTTDNYWRTPHRWNRGIAESADMVRRRVFCASLADVFEDWSDVVTNAAGAILYRCPKCSADFPSRAHCPHCESRLEETTFDDLRRDLIAMIDATPHLDWLLVTKRPENILRMWPIPANGRDPSAENYLRRDNVWLLTSVATQEDAEQNVPELLKCRDLAPVLGVSAEPLLGPLEPGWSWISTDDPDGACPTCGEIACHHTPLDWVICGGESGPNARPMHPQWARDLRGQCAAAGVPFFFKQWGEYHYDPPASVRGHLHDLYRRGASACSPGLIRYFYPNGDLTPAGDGCTEPGYCGVYRVGKKAAGRMLDGRTHEEFPEVAHAV